MIDYARQQHASETAKPTRMERRLCNTIADLSIALQLFGIPRERAGQIILEELEFRLFPVGQRPAEKGDEGVIERQKQESPF